MVVAATLRGYRDVKYGQFDLQAPLTYLSYGDYSAI